MRLARRRRLRLLLRDLSAGAAYAAVAISGAVPEWVSLCFLVSLGLALLGKRPLAQVRAASIVALLVVGAVLFGLVFRGRLDLVVAAVSFASLVTAQRMLSTPDAATDHQVLLAALLLIAGAAALSGDLWYAICLLAFGVFACLALGLAMVEGPTERDEPMSLAPVLRQISLGVLLALAGGVAFFVTFPRLSWNVAARRAGTPLFGGTTGMTDRVRLGGGGNLKTNARAVLRAKLQPDPGQERLGRYWVGRHFDTFDGREWAGSGAPQRPAMQVVLGALSRSAVTQRIELLPAYEARTLIGLDRPVSYGQAVVMSTSGSAPTPLVEVPGDEVRFAMNGNAYRYVVTSSAPPPPTKPLDPTLRERTLALPEHLDPRVVQLALDAGGAGSNARETSRRMEQWLQTNLGYTLELPGEVDDPLADFLFARRAGHCEHFATALAVMLRTRGIPSRVVGGFYGGERIGENYVVRGGDAHAWVEAWVDGEGWVSLDPTPETGRPSQPFGLVARVVEAWEQLEERWRGSVIDYSFFDQVDFVRRVVRPLRSRPAGDAPAPGEPGGERTPAGALVAACAAALVTWLVWRRLTGGSGARRHAASSLYEGLERRLTRAHTGRRRGEPLEETSARLVAEHHPAAAAVALATRRYLEARFGQRPLAPGERRALLHGVDEALKAAAARPPR